MGIINITSYFIKFHKPGILRKLVFTAEILVLLAACLTLLAILKLHPIPLVLFLIIAQPFFIIGIILYLIVTVSWFLSHYGTTQVSYAPGETIFRKGDKGEFVYTIMNGNVEIIQEDIDGEEKVLAVLGPGDYFGEMALISDSPRNATARAANPVEVMTIAEDDFKKLHDYIPALKDNIDKVMQSRMSGLKTKDT